MGHPSMVAVWDTDIQAAAAAGPQAAGPNMALAAVGVEAVAVLSFLAMVGLWGVAAELLWYQPSLPAEAATRVPRNKPRAPDNTLGTRGRILHGVQVAETDSRHLSGIYPVAL